MMPPVLPLHVRVSGKPISHLNLIRLPMSADVMVYAVYDTSVQRQLEYREYVQCYIFSCLCQLIVIENVTIRISQFQ